MLLRTSLILAIAFLSWCFVTYPKVGHLTYAFAAQAESTIYGLEERVISIDNFTYSYYDNAPSTPKEPLSCSMVIRLIS